MEGNDSSHLPDKQYLFPIPQKEKNPYQKKRFQREHEVVIKLTTEQQEILTLLISELFQDIHLVKSEDGKWVWCYCKYYGDINELDQVLEALKGKAITGLGESGGNRFLEFFVDIKSLPISGTFPTETKVRRRHGLLLYSLLAVGLSAFLIILYFSLLPLISSMSKPRENPLSMSHPSWNKFVFPQYQAGWSEIEREFGFNDQDMIDLFRQIKDVEKYSYGYGQMLNDLTIYPEIIRRALNILILKNIRTTNDLSFLLSELKPAFIWNHAFPDQQEGYYSNLEHSQFENRVIFVFYEDVLLKDDRFGQQLITKITSHPKP